MAILFDNVDDYFSHPNISAYGITADITIAMWINRANTLQNDMMLAKGSGGADYDFYFLAANDLLRFYSAGLVIGEAVSTGSVIADGWHHVAVTRIGTGFTFYIDGVAAGTATDGSALDNGANPIFIGQDDTAGSFFNGRMAYTVLFNRGLSVGEINQVMSMATPLTGLVLHNPLFDAVGTDLSGNSNNGTAFGSPVIGDGPPVGPPFGFDMGFQGNVSLVLTPGRSFNLDFNRNFNLPYN